MEMEMEWRVKDLKQHNTLEWNEWNINFICHSSYSGLGNIITARHGNGSV